MNNLVADYLLSRLAELSWLQEPAGLVNVVRRKMGEGAMQVFPVACNTSWTDCQNNASIHKKLAPDNSKRTVSYFEDKGVARVNDNGKLRYNSRLRLVVWVNLNKFSYTGCTITPLMIAQIIESLEGNPANYQGLTELRVQGITIPEKNPVIFQPYTFLEERQFMLYPYDYFALDIDTTFLFKNACMNEIQLNNEPC